MIIFFLIIVKHFRFKVITMVILIIVNLEFKEWTIIIISFIDLQFIKLFFISTFTMPVKGKFILQIISFIVNLD